VKQANNLNASSVAGSALAGAVPEATGINLPDAERDSTDPIDSDSVATAASNRPADEDDLVLRSLAEDHDAFEALVRRHSPRVFSIIGSFFRRRDMVEDIAQEVFAKAYFSLATFTIGRSFEAWVARIAVNACYDQLRVQRRRIEQQAPHETQQEDDWFEIQMLEVARARHSSSERQREAADIAERLMGRLDPDDRIVITLMDRDGYSVKEVSDMTGWGQSKVKVRAFRARRTLRAAMKRIMLSAERRQRSKQ
jgi:RNA polymerase sigma-70 factor, ECF subfamily